MTDEPTAAASSTGCAQPHNGTVCDGYYRDFGGYWVDGNALTVDHLVTNSGTVLVRVNGTPLDTLGAGEYRHHEHDETGGVSAAGF